MRLQPADSIEDAVLGEQAALGRYDNSPTERAAAFRRVLRSTRTRVEEDEALWMCGLHYRPEPPAARRNPMYPSKVIPASRAVPDGD